MEKNAPVVFSRSPPYTSLHLKGVMLELQCRAVLGHGPDDVLGSAVRELCLDLQRDGDACTNLSLQVGDHRLGDTPRIQRHLSGVEPHRTMKALRTCPDIALRRGAPASKGSPPIRNGRRGHSAVCWGSSRWDGILRDPFFRIHLRLRSLRPHQQSSALRAAGDVLAAPEPKVADACVSAGGAGTGRPVIAAIKPRGTTTSPPRSVGGRAES